MAAPYGTFFKNAFDLLYLYDRTMPTASACAALIQASVDTANGQTLLDMGNNDGYRVWLAVGYQASVATALAAGGAQESAPPTTGALGTALNSAIARVQARGTRLHELQMMAQSRKDRCENFMQRAKAFVDPSTDVAVNAPIEGLFGVSDL